MSDSKPSASLSPTLLARKGAARPAMRPQWQPLSNYSTEVPLPPEGLHQHEPLEDLGWNDMGEHGQAYDEPTVVPFGPGEGRLDHAFSSGPPEVLRQQGTLAEQLIEAAGDGEEFDEAYVAAFEDAGTEPDSTDEPAFAPEHDPADEPPALIPLAAHRLARAASQAVERRSALVDGRRAAFTLRVDEARHLKLRLACTVQGRSAQQIVTEALDRLLDELPGLDDLAKRARRR